MDQVKEIFAGGVGGISMCLAGHPFDTVKVRLQTQKDNKYKGMVHTFQTIVKEEGPAAVYRGVQSPLLGMMAMNATVFWSYANACKVARAIHGGPADEQLPMSSLLGAGFAAGAAVAFVEGPVDHLKCQLQVSNQYKGLVDCARKVYQQAGLRGIYRGLGATVARNAPANMAYFGTYETLKRVMTPAGESAKDLSAWKLFVAGGMGGVMYWSLTFPLDLVKSTIQTDSLTNPKYTGGTVATFRAILAEHGPAGFTRGLTPMLVRAFPANAAAFLTYELVKKQIGL